MTARAMQCEHKVADIIAAQERHGVNFDTPTAIKLVEELTEKIEAVDKEAIPQLPLMWTKGTSYKKVFKLSGAPTDTIQKYCNKVGLDISLVSGVFTAYWPQPFDMAKTARVKYTMITLGWKPNEWNHKDERDFDTAEQRCLWVKDYIEKHFTSEPSRVYRNVMLRALRFKGKRTYDNLYDHIIEMPMVPTSAVITEESLDTLEGNVGMLLKDRIQLAHRKGLLVGLLDKLRPDGKLSASANSCATPTFRANYRVVVNIPASRSFLGEEIRSLFIPDNSDHVFLGSDAAGLEARMLAHYMNDPVFTDALLNGDVHTMNQKIAGLPTRDDAKSMLYALMYGAGDNKLGQIVGGGAREGKQIRARLEAGLPSLGRLVERTKKASEKGYLIGLDGRKVLMRRDKEGKVQTHKALNTLLQSAGAIVMKYGMIIINQAIEREGLRAHQVLWQHDELQFSVHKDDVERVTYHANNYVRLAGELLNLNVPLASDAMVGKSWYETH